MNAFRIIRIPTLAVFVILLGGAGVSLSKGSGSSAPAHLREIQCATKVGRHHQPMMPTGCLPPFNVCQDATQVSNPIRACQLAGETHQCPDFTWEKCCFTVCNQKNANRENLFGEPGNCIELCALPPEANTYRPQPAKIAK